MSTAISFVYFVFLWSSGGRATLGMRLLKLQIGNADDGGTLGLDDGDQAVVRHGQLAGPAERGAGPGQPRPASASSCGTSSLLVTTGSSPSRQGLHDRFARTAIVQTGPAGSAWVIGCLAIVIVFVLLFFVSIVGLIFLGSQVSDILERARP